MPHLGPHALGESAMLQHLGHLRWQAFQRLVRIPTHRVADAEGRRLYATFYHVDIDFPRSAPPHAFRENDRVVWVGGLAAWGRNILDGHFALHRARDSCAEAWGAPDEASRARFVAAGIPVVRLSNIFVTQEQGPGRLRIGQPANVDFSRIAAAAAAPDGQERNRQARATGRFFDPPPGAAPSPPLVRTVEHAIDPDRDVNAAGLVYFANFPAFFHVAERRALSAGTWETGLGGLVARRGTLRRCIGLFGNVRADDRLLLRAECALLPEPIEADTPARPHGLMWFNVHVARRSDEGLVAITTAERAVPLTEPGDVARWRDASQHAG